MVTCTICLETIDGEVSTHQFNCGCQITLHEACKMELMEQGRLQYCWYCQRVMLNDTDTETPPEEPTGTPQETQTVSSNMEYPNYWMIGMYCISIVAVSYNLFSPESDVIFIFAYLSLMIYSFILLVKMIRFIVQNPCREYYATRIILMLFTSLQWFTLLVLKQYYMMLFVILSSFASQFYIVAIVRINRLNVEHQ